MNPRLLAVVVLSSVCAFYTPAWADDAPAAATEETAPAASAMEDEAAPAMDPAPVTEAAAPAETAPSATAAPAAAGKEEGKDKDGGKADAKDGPWWKNPFGPWVWVVIGFLGAITVWYTLFRPRAKQDE